ncbi:MAG: RHS repeat-associated core domain-containing protein [Thermoleophilia bacterium]
MTARVKITSTNASTGTAGLVFRSDLPLPPAVDSSEYYLGIYPDEDSWKLWKVVSGSWGAAAVATGSLTINLNQYYTLSVRAQGAQMRIFIDGVEQNAANPYTDSSYFTNPYVGLRSRNAVASFDDVRAIGLGYNPSTTYRYSDASGDLINELDAAGNVTASYVLDASGNAIAVKRGSTMYYLHYNAHGDVIAITSATGAILARFTYDPWGAPTEYSATGAPQTIGAFAGSPGQGLFLLFGGMLYDAAAGIYLTKSRAYNPKTGRFLQRDILDEDAKGGYTGFPFGKDAIGSNLYAWCGNNPVTQVDPSGMWSFRDLLARFFGARGAAVGGLIDYTIGYVSGRVGGGGYSGYGYSGGGYGFKGNTAGRKAMQAVKATPPPPPAWTRSGPTVPKATFRSASQQQHLNESKWWGTDCAGAEIGLAGLASYGVGALVGGLPGVAIGGIGNRVSLVTGVINDAIQLRDQHNYAEFGIKTGASLIAFQVPGLDPWVGGGLTAHDAYGCIEGNK